MNCPTPEQLLAYLEGGTDLVSPAEARHIQECARCATRLAELRRTADALRVVSCPTSEELVDMAAQCLPTDRSQELAKHVAQCAACAELLQDGAELAKERSEAPAPSDAALLATARRRFLEQMSHAGPLARIQASLESLRHGLAELLATEQFPPLQVAARLAMPATYAEAPRATMMYRPASRLPLYAVIGRLLAAPFVGLGRLLAAPFLIVGRVLLAPFAALRASRSEPLTARPQYRDVAPLPAECIPPAVEPVLARTMVCKPFDEYMADATSVFHALSWHSREVSTAILLLLERFPAVTADEAFAAVRSPAPRELLDIARQTMDLWQNYIEHCATSFPSCPNCAATARPGVATTSPGARFCSNCGAPLSDTYCRERAHEHMHELEEQVRRLEEHFRRSSEN